MKINTIITYVLVYLLTGGHWNILVPVKADSEGDGSSGGVVAGDGSGSTDASSTVATPADGSSASTDASASLTSGSVAAPANEADGSSSADGSGAGSSLPSGSSGESADAGSSGEAASTEDPNASADASLASVPADGTTSGEDGSSGQAAPSTETVLLNGMYPDSHTSGWHVDMVGPDPNLKAKREEARRLAAEARKAADELQKAADKLKKEAEELNESAEKPLNISELSAKMVETASKVNTEMKRAEDMANQLDMTYYGGFPTGWHFHESGALIKAIEDREEMMTKNMTYYDGFPDGWHFGNPMVLKDLVRHELKGEIEVKRARLESLRKIILDLTTQMEDMEKEVKKLEDEHEELVKKLRGLDAALIKLYKDDGRGNPVQLEENNDYTMKKVPSGDVRFEFKDDVKCTLVKYGEVEVWNKGKHDVQEPKLVAFNDGFRVIAVRDNDRTVLYKKETSTELWNHYNTIVKPARTGARSASSSTSGSTLEQTSRLSTSTASLDGSSTGTPESPDTLGDTTSAKTGEGNENNDTGLSGLRGSAGPSSQSAEASVMSSIFMD